ncbi:MAG: DRTGG domain-containing protein [Chloroflexota bacterium]
MKTAELAGKLGLKLVSGANGLEREITGGYTSDLLSDVIGSAKEGNVWITLQTHQNIVAVASLKELAAVIIVKGFNAADETIRRSNEESIPVLSTEEDTFAITGRLYGLLKKE